MIVFVMTVGDWSHGTSLFETYSTEAIARSHVKDAFAFWHRSYGGTLEFHAVPDEMTWRGSAGAVVRIKPMTVKEE